MSKKEKEKQPKLELSEESEQRIKDIITALGTALVTRQYKLHKNYGFLAEGLMANLMGILLDVPYHAEINGRCYVITPMHERKHGWTVGISLTDNIGLAKRDEFIRGLTTFIELGQPHHINRLISYGLPKPPSTFYYSPERWSIEPNQRHSPHDKRPKKERDIITHLATALLGSALADTHQSTRDMVFLSLQYQLETYVKTGSLEYLKQKSVDPKNPKLANPMTFLGNMQFNLELKYAKFCKKCGTRIGDCYCHDVREEFNHEAIALSDICGKCTRLMIDKALKGGEFDSKHTMIECTKELESYMEGYIEQAFDELPEIDVTNPSEEWTNRYGDWLEPGFDEWVDDEGVKAKRALTWKKLDDETLKRLWKAVDSLYADMYDGDPDEDGCSCPTWAGE